MARTRLWNEWRPPGSPYWERSRSAVFLLFLLLVPSSFSSFFSALRLLSLLFVSSCFVSLSVLLGWFRFFFWRGLQRKGDRRFYSFFFLCFMRSSSSSSPSRSLFSGLLPVLTTSHLSIYVYLSIVLGFSMLFSSPFLQVLIISPSSDSVLMSGCMYSWPVCLDGKRTGECSRVRRESQSFLSHLFSPLSAVITVYIHQSIWGGWFLREIFLFCSRLEKTQRKSELTVLR